MIYTPFVFPLLLAALIMIAIGFYARRFRTVPAAGSFSVLMGLCTGLALIYALEISTTSLSLQILLEHLRFLPLAFIAPLVLVLGLEYTTQSIWLTRQRALWLFSVPVITIVLAYFPHLKNRIPEW